MKKRILKVGIVVEYNPFHNGHLYQINKIKKIFGEKIILVIIVSGDFVQRGEMSFLNKWEKTQAALKSGIDLIVELPLYYSIQNAEIFSKISTKTLDYLNIDIQVFGAEEENIEKLKKVIEIQESQNYKNKLMEYMKLGNSYTSSQRLALEEYGLQDVVKSNNILAIEYMREIKKEKLKINPYVIKREISEYNEKKVKKSRKNFASASFIRSKIEFEGQNIDYDEIGKYVPNEVIKIIKEKVGKKRDEKKIKEKIFEIFKYKILTEEKEKILQIYDISEEIYRRLTNVVKKSQNFFEFTKNVKSRNFSNKRIDRIIFNVLLNIKESIMNYEIDYVRVLGFNHTGRLLLKDLKEKKVFVNWKDIEKFSKTENNKILKEKVKIEKNGFLLKELFLKEKENLNPIIKK